MLPFGLLRGRMCSATQMLFAGRLHSYTEKRQCRVTKLKCVDDRRGKANISDHKSKINYGASDEPCLKL